MSTPQWPHRDESGRQPAPSGPPGTPGLQPGGPPGTPGSQPGVPYPAGGYATGPGYPGGGQSGYAAAPAQGYQQPGSGHYPPSAGPGGYRQNNDPSNQGYGQNSYGPTGYSQSADQTIYAPQSLRPQSFNNHSYSDQPYSHQSHRSAGYPAPGVPGGPAPIIAGILLFLAGLAAAVVAGLIWLDVDAYDYAAAVFGLGIPVLIKTPIDPDILFITSIVVGLLTAVLSIVLMRRVRGVRIPLAILGIIGTAYYAYQLLYNLTDQVAFEYQPTSQLVVQIVVLAIWLAGTIMTLLPTSAGATT